MSSEEIAEKIADGPDFAAERQRGGTTEKEALRDVALERSGELRVDAELADLRVAVAQTALDQAVPLE